MGKEENIRRTKFNLSVRRSKVVEVDHRVPIIGEPMVVGKVIGNNQMGVVRYVCDTCVRESKLEKIRMVANFLRGRMSLVEFGDEFRKEHHTLATGLFGKLPQKITDFRKNWRGRDCRLEMPKQTVEKLKIVCGERVGSRKPINSIGILGTNDVEEKQVGVDDNAFGPVLNEKLFEVVRHFRQIGSS